MSYDEKLAARVRGIFSGMNGARERKMFGGVAFILRGNMCCGVIDDLFMARVGPGQYEGALALPHVRPMDFNGKPRKGYVYVEPAGHREDVDLKVWIDRCIDFVLTLPEK